MYTYSNVDNILTPSLINISPFVDTEISDDIVRSMGPDNNFTLSVISRTPTHTSVQPKPTTDNVSKLSSPIEIMNQSRKLKTLPREFPIIDLLSVNLYAPSKNIDLDNLTDLSLKDLLNYPDSNVNSLADLSLKDLLDYPDSSVKQLAMDVLEERITTGQGKCHVSIAKNLRVGLFQLDPKRISEYLESRGRYDHNYQDGVGCLIGALLSDEDITPDIRIRRWITDINKIGEASSEGIIFRLSSNPSKLSTLSGEISNNFSYPLFVVKMAANPENDTLCHEALVGMGAINKLRNRVPNFIHTYGAFMCAPPMLNSNGEVISWLPSKRNGITYLVLENIQDAKSLASLAKDLTNDQFLQIYLQVLNAINIAFKEFDFTHYDLHDHNILIQALPYDVSIPLYTQDGKISYIKTRHLARIIDYGMSHIYLQGQHFGKYEFESLGINAESSFPMYDAYKILLFTYENSAHHKISGFFDVADNIYEFFNEDGDINTRVSERENNGNDYYQFSDSHKNLTIDNLISFIISKFNINFIASDQPSDAVATICQDSCISWNEFTQHVFNPSKLPDTIQDYCQAELAIDNLSADKSRIKLQKWIRQFNIKSAYDQEKNSIVDKLNKSIRELNIVSLITLRDPLFDYGIYEKHIQTLIRIQYQLLNIQLWLDDVSCVFNRNSNISYVSQNITQLTNGLTIAHQRFTDHLNIIQFNKDNDKDSIFTNEMSILHDILLNK